MARKANYPKANFPPKQSPFKFFGTAFQMFWVALFLFVGFVVASSIIIQDDSNRLSTLKQKAASHLPLLAPSTDEEGQPEIAINVKNTNDLPQPSGEAKSFEQVKEETGEKTTTTTNQEPVGETDTGEWDIPPEVNLDIPFFAQAPDGDWTLPRKEACEEASIALGAYYLNGISPSKERFKEEILEMVDLEEELFGTYIDTSIAETQRLFQEYYGIGSSQIIDDPTIEDLKYHLSQGHPIVAPFAGRELGNSYFTDGGPRYHMLIIRGYDDTYFYTNDVGTRQGENFPYTYDTIMNSLHDLTDGNIRTGAKRVLVLMKDE